VCSSDLAPSARRAAEPRPLPAAPLSAPAPPNPGAPLNPEAPTTGTPLRRAWCEMRVLGSVSAMAGAIAGPRDGFMPVPKTRISHHARPAPTLIANPCPHARCNWAPAAFDERSNVRVGRALRGVAVLGTAVNTSMWASGSPSMARTIPKTATSRSTLLGRVPVISAEPFRAGAACRSLAPCRTVQRRGCPGAAGEAELAPGLVEGDRRGVREIEAAVAGPERNAQPGVVGQAIEHLRGQSARLRPEQERVPVGEAGVVQRAQGAGRQRVHSAAAERREARLEAVMLD